MEEVKTLKQLRENIEKVLLLKDEGVIEAVACSVIANRMTLEPVWLMLVAGSSAGKSAIIECLDGLKFIHSISDLTPNTFASGQRNLEKSASLLHRMDKGIMSFKDFTSLLSKNKEQRAEIIAQLREIYDGKYTKRTGNSVDVVWKGKLGAIAGSTEAIYQHMNEMSNMGNRFVLYSIDPPNRREAGLRSMQNNHKMNELRKFMADSFTSYINRILKFVFVNKISRIDLDKDTELDLLNVADFATLARSAVIEDFKSGKTKFVPAPEMPMRMVSQLCTMASAFKAMHIAEGSEDSSLTAREKKVLYKIAFDSIPRSRRDVLLPLAKYKQGVSTAGMAILLNLPTEAVARYLYQINALKLCNRSKKGGKQGDVWTLVPDYRHIIQKLNDMEILDQEYMAQDKQLDMLDFDDDTEYDTGFDLN